MTHPYGSTRADCPADDCSHGTLIVSRHGIECRTCGYRTEAE